MYYRIAFTSSKEEDDEVKTPVMPDSFDVYCEIKLGN